jgi:hypothetical protein
VWQIWQNIVDWLAKLVYSFRVPAAPIIQSSNMPKPVVAVINSSTVMKDSELSDIVQALQIQVSTHFAPIYGQDATLVQVKSGQTPPAGSWWLVFLDSSDVAGALGYHDLTNEGLPLGKVFAGTDLQYGNMPSVTASHELLEMLGDPYCGTAVQRGSRFYAYETADAVEADALGYYVGSQHVKLSDFVYPAWFADAGQGKMDYCGHLAKPFELAPGGYISYLDLSAGQGWQQEFAARETAVQDPTARARVGSRRERRRTPLDQWVRSEAHTLPVR